ncbi:MAG: ribosome-recycling factor [Cyclobacteriaceae bacterium]|nr:MAG: ribosome-recycling factor [Cyclobacteriaceae bacterium]
MEDIEFYIEHAEESMEKSLQHTAGTIAKIRAGKAMPSMLDGIMVEYYGNPTPINQVASVNSQDARTLVIKPWEKTIVSDIERSIINSDLGLNPQNDGELIRINIPVLTEERRVDLVKQARNEAEHGRVSIRNIRKDANDNLKKLIKEHVSEDDVRHAEDQVQKLTDQYISKIEEVLKKKEEDIMTV